MAFNITEEQQGDALILRMSGRLDASNAQSVEGELMGFVTEGVHLCLDFSEVQFVSSAGLRIFLMMAKKVRPLKGKLVLFGLKPVVKDVFVISGFSKILTIKDSQEEALAALA